MQCVVYRPWFERRDLRPASLLLHLCLRPDYGPLTGAEAVAGSGARLLPSGKAKIMAKTSAGLLLYRVSDRVLQVFLAHPGGPLWAKKDLGAWSIPKGELDPADEDALAAARREFAEETGQRVTGDFIPLTPLKQPGGKTVHAWAVEGECDPGAVRSNLFTMEWPPRSGRRQEFPEIDRAGWFSIEEAHGKILKGQAGFLDELVRKLAEVRERIS